MKKIQEPGFDECLKLDDGTTIHCSPTSMFLKDEGIRLNVNSRNENGVTFSFHIPFKSRKEVKLFTDYINKTYEHFNKE